MKQYWVFTSAARPWWGRSVLVLVAALAGCASAPEPKAPAGEHSLAQAVQASTDHLLGTAAKKRGAPGFWARWFPQTVVLMPVFDGQSNQQTQAGLRAGQGVQEAMRQRHPGFRTVDLANPQALATADFRLDAKLTPAAATQGSRLPPRYVFEQRLIALKDGQVLARSSAVVSDAGIDLTPTAFYQDSPVTMSLQPPDAAAASPGQQVLAAARVQLATEHYLGGRFDRGLSAFAEAAKMPGVDMQAALVGQYLSLVRLNRTAQAEQAFVQLVAHGLKAGSLGVKLLFAPGSTQYWPDAALTQAYPTWLRAIAQQAAALPGCLRVAGHTSRTGTETFNLELSQRRAVEVSRQLATSLEALTPRLQTEGLGWQHNLVGTGTDDLRDAVDRRVEFRMVPCL